VKAFYAFIALSLFSYDIRATTCDRAIIYFIPFGIEEYTPMYFNNNIRKKAAEKWAVTDPVRIAQLMSIVSGGTRYGYRDGYTRAAIECGKITFFINKEGGVETSSGESFKINVRKFVKFHDSLTANERVPLD
jgi:hypothetical protein